MEIIVLDNDPAARAVLLGRLQELKRGRELQGIAPVPVLARSIAEKRFTTVCAIILGPGLSGTDTTDLVNTLKQKTTCPIVALFHPAPPGVLSIAADSDEALKTFLVQSLARSHLAKVAEARKVIGVAQFAGGVGATSLVMELGKYFAQQSIKTALIDLDDVTTQLSLLGKAAPRYRAAVSEALLGGVVGDVFLDEMLAPIDTNLAIIPQPESYSEAFHFKANVIENAPAASVMLNSLLSTLRSKDYEVIIDLGRSWGLAAFAALPRCGQILLVVGAPRVERIKQSLDCLRRFKRESDATDEFDTTRWQIVVTHSDIAKHAEIRQIVLTSGLFPESVGIHFLLPPGSDAFATELARLARQLL